MVFPAFFPSRPLPVLYCRPMKKRTATTILLLTLPAAVLALDFEHGDDRYADSARLSAAERAAVSVLTDVGAVSGNPDGSFAAERTLNRAEFTKIALLSRGVGVYDSDASSCFPDVPANAWFARYVCRAKKDGAVEGNPDGLFHPERPVNLAEATKILVELAGFDLPQPEPNERWAWYTGYLKAADAHGVALDGASADASLTRGQMARLAAAFVAERQGMLAEYRDAERGVFPESASSSSEESSSSSDESSSSSSSASSERSSSSSSVALYPARNSFLLTGTRTPLVLGGPVTSVDESSYLRRVDFVLRREITSIDRMYLVDANGEPIVEFTLGTSNNNDHRKWEAVAPESTFLFSADAPTTVGIRFDLKQKDYGGVSNQLVETESFQIQTQGQNTSKTKYLFPNVEAYPVHQTAYGRITSVKSLVASTGTIPQGDQRKIASFTIDARTASGGTVTLEGIDLVATLADASFSNVRVGDADAKRLSGCGVEKLESSSLISCGNLPPALSQIPPEGLTVSLYADVALTGPNDGMLTIATKGRGAIGTNGTFRWTDGAGDFSWIEQDAPFGGDVTWIVTK